MMQRARSAVAVVLGLAFAANAFWMLTAPESWYHSVPGVATTGPLNAHFIRDIGCAYLVVALSLLWMARSPKAWPSALAGGWFLSLHALVHVLDTVSGREKIHQFAIDFPGVIVPAGLVVWIAWPRKDGDG